MVYKGREEQYLQARELRRQGYGYRSIGSRVNVPWKTVSVWVKDIEVSSDVAHRLASKDRRLPLEQLKSLSKIRLRLIELRGHQCESCNLSMWLGEPIMLELHHIERDHGDGEDNLLLLCPNCHSMTPNWKNRK